jgi:hypothetical protein
MTLPSISLFPSARFTDDSEVRHHLSIGGNSRFSRKCNNTVTILAHAIYRKSPPRRRTCQENVKSKECTIGASACSGECLAHERRMIRNETSAAGGSQASSTDRRPDFFLNFVRFSSFGAAPMLSREPQSFLRKPRTRSMSISDNFFTEGSEENKGSYF